MEEQSSSSAAAVTDSKAGLVLSSVAEVVERVLSFVPTRSLLRSAGVCRLWRNCARRVLRTQQRMTWLAVAGDSRQDGHALLHVLDKELENVYLLPQTVVLMMDNENFSSPECCNQKKARRSSSSEEVNVTEMLQRVFPKSCVTVGITTPGIVLTPQSPASATPQEYEEGQAGFALLFPNIDRVQITHFHFCKHTLTTEAMEQAGLVGNSALRVVLLFCYKTYKSGASQFMNKLLKPFSHTNVLIAGGHVDSAFSPHRDCCSPSAYGVVGVALSGARVQGASVLLEQEVSSAAASEAVMQRLKAARVPECNTIGLMFACVGRGHRYYNNEHGVESAAFRKVFPSVPLFGFFGNGEIGCDRIVKDSFTLSHTHTDELQHGYTTVMALVHLG
ncbi:F-box only protein 22 isoform X2 [Denticeps clupeoides]|uniref:FIST C-domain domain-containing protein n=1 Tax=Denticeps clupeoides TaxID=299321 RepID=A0AAY4C256_9TELE|nr:F-box only protein 22 isoform X1 [Denticeps clupeoides]XP_028822118.1 F-box only protein 22 isoform X2 [Denticeps clupeoides]